MVPPPRVLLIGWDAADWKVITPLMDAGKMTHLERVVNNGVTRNRASLYPGLSPMLWTFRATGKRPSHPAEQTAEYRHDGVVAMSGPGVQTAGFMFGIRGMCT